MCWDSILRVCADDATAVHYQTTIMLSKDCSAELHSLGSHSVFHPEMSLVLPGSRAAQVRQQGMGMTPRCSVGSAAPPAWCKCSPSQTTDSSPFFVLPSLISQIFTVFLHRLKRTRRILFTYINREGLCREHNFFGPPNWGTRDKVFYVFTFSQLEYTPFFLFDVS